MLRCSPAEHDSSGRIGCPEWWWNTLPSNQEPAAKSAGAAGDASDAGAAFTKLADASAERLFMSCRHVALGGAAMYGIMYVGVLMELCRGSRRQYARWASKLKTVAGTSAGALIGAMVASGIDPHMMRQVVLQCRLDRIMAHMDSTGETVVASGALSTGVALDDTLREVVAALTGRDDTTLLEFYARTRRCFVVVVTNTVSNSAEFWSYKTQPHMPLWLALRCSASVPLAFQPYTVNGVPYIDGGITCNLPSHLFAKQQHETLSLCVVGKIGAPYAPCAAAVKAVAARRNRGVRPGRQRDATVSPGRDVAQVVGVYTDHTQLSALRACPGLAFRTIPCTASQETRRRMGPLAHYSFHADGAAIDSIIEDGRRAVAAVQLRDVLLAHMVVQGAAARASAQTGDG